MVPSKLAVASRLGSSGLNLQSKMVSTWPWGRRDTVSRSSFFVTHVWGCQRIPSLAGSPTSWLPCRRAPRLRPWSSRRRGPEAERRSGSATGSGEGPPHWWNWCTDSYWGSRSSELQREEGCDTNSPVESVESWMQDFNNRLKQMSCSCNPVRAVQNQNLMKTI